MSLVSLVGLSTLLHLYIGLRLAPALPAWGSVPLPWPSRRNVARFDLACQAQPSWAGYQSLQTFAAIIRRDLDRKPGFKARDMIDVQSFIWGQGSDEYEA